MWKMQNPLIPLKSLEMFCDIRYIREKIKVMFCRSPYLFENLWKIIVTSVTIVTNVEDAEPSHAFKISQNVL